MNEYSNTSGIIHHRCRHLHDGSGLMVNGGEEEHRNATLLVHRHQHNLAIANNDSPESEPTSSILVNDVSIVSLNLVLQAPPPHVSSSSSPEEEEKDENRVGWTCHECRYHRHSTTNSSLLPLQQQEHCKRCHALQRSVIVVSPSPSAVKKPPLRHQEVLDVFLHKHSVWSVYHTNLVRLEQWLIDPNKGTDDSKLNVKTFYECSNPSDYSQQHATDSVCSSSLFATMMSLDELSEVLFLEGMKFTGRISIPGTLGEGNGNTDYELLVLERRVDPLGNLSILCTHGAYADKPVSVKSICCVTYCACFNKTMQRPHSLTLSS